MYTSKLNAGAAFPALTVEKLGGGKLTLKTPSPGFDWKLVVVYRGKHCPICTRYLGELKDALSQFHELGVDVAAVSADPLEKVTEQMALVNPNYDIGYNLSVEQMQTLGLYVSQPRSAQETDRPFAEPGLFVINGNGEVQVTDISNAPFARPDLKSLLMGLKFIRDPANIYPIRGTHATT